MFKKIILKILSSLARKVILKHKPFVIWITGTVWKTTATHFVYDFVSNLYPGETYMSPYDYNWEFWLPLTILKSKSPNKNLLMWLYVFLKWLLLLLSKDYPKYLILEYWIDHKDEMRFLTDIVKPQVAILLNISQNHVTQFPLYKDYINEKLLLWKVAEQVIYNSDDDNLNWFFKNNFKGTKFSYSVKDKDSSIHASDINSDIRSISFSVTDWDDKINTSFSLIWEYQVYNVLPVFALAKCLGISMEKTSEIISGIHPQKWRWCILKWIKDSVIIDWSYNWWFVAIVAWIDYVSKLPDMYNKILLLWDMRELWPESKRLHTELAEKIVSSWIKNIVLVWEEMKNYVEEIVRNGINDWDISWFKSSKDAWENVRTIIQKSDDISVVFVKGSQNTIFLEEGIKKFLFDISDMKNLCRQSPHWQSVKDHFFQNII